MAAAEEQHQEEQQAWDALPFSAVEGIVAVVSQLPPHQARATLVALRLLCRHWRAAVDDAMPEWHAPLATSAGAAAAVLGRWRHLRRLTLQHVELDGVALDALACCRRLEFLHLCVVAAPRGLFEAVARLPALRVLFYQPADGVAEGPRLAPLSACTALSRFDVHSTWASSVAPDLSAALQHLHNLQHLGCIRSVRAVAAQAQQAFDLGCAAQLSSLDLRASFTCDDAFLQLFDALPHLRRLDISSNRNLTDGGFLGITRLAGSLTELVLEGGHSLTEDGATALARLTRLRSLSLGWSNSMSGDALLPLIANALCGLTHLDIRGCRRACAPHAFAALSRLTSLRRLVAKGCLLQQDAVHTLALLTGLQQLDVAENRRLLALGSWTALRELQLLDVSECGLEDAHLVPLLATLPLRTALVSDNHRLTAAVLEALSAGPARACLRSLSAASLQLDGNALVALLPHFAALETLSLSGNDARLDPEALLRAAEAAPSLHTLSLYEVRLASAKGWHRMAAARWSPGRRRLLAIRPWDAPSFQPEEHM